MHSAEHVQEQQNDQDKPEDSHASPSPASPISVIATTTAEREHQDNNDQDQQHGNLLSQLSGLTRSPSADRLRQHQMGDGLALDLTLPNMLTAPAGYGFGR